MNFPRERGFFSCLFFKLFFSMGGEDSILAPVFWHSVLGHVFSVHLPALHLPAVRWPLPEGPLDFLTLLSLLLRIRLPCASLSPFSSFLLLRR